MLNKIKTNQLSGMEKKAKEELIIKAITEAFSMQPIRIEIDYQKKYDDLKHRYREKTDAQIYTLKTCVKEIKLVTEEISENNVLQFYVSYNFDGEKVYSHLRNSVNVEYLTAK